MAIVKALRRAGEVHPEAYTKITAIHWDTRTDDVIHLEVSTWANEEDRRSGKPPLEVRPYEMLNDSKIEGWVMALVLKLGYKDMKQHSHYDEAKNA